uniref:Uncharacterized protein n=1 Tax=Meloidogyne javanica TaxID=6303 RepID=A0A915MGF0_MELJA
MHTIHINMDLLVGRWCTKATLEAILPSGGYGYGRPSGGYGYGRPSGGYGYGQTSGGYGGNNYANSFGYPAASPNGYPPDYAHGRR